MIGRTAGDAPVDDRGAARGAGPASAGGGPEDERFARQKRERFATELNAGREGLRALILQMPTPVALLVGPDHRYGIVNDAYLRISGGGRDLVGLTLREVFPELEEQGVLERFRAVYETGEPWVGPEALVRHDRRVAGVTDSWLDLHLTPVRDPDGTVVAILNLAVDVTEQVLARREAERLLSESEAARREAESANRAKSEFLAVMSHELRTPLNAISGYTDLLEMEVHGPINAAQRKALNRIQVSQQHLLGLINEVLTYAKLESGSVRYDITAVRAQEALEVIEAMVEPQARARDVRVDIADSPRGLQVLADPDKLRQILVNLLSNAIKFTEPGGRIVLSCASHGRDARLVVSDTGIGIPGDKLEMIFEPFVQVRADLKRTAAGTGLGLAISRILARGMGGDLVAESTPGSGSTFTLKLPMPEE